MSRRKPNSSQLAIVDRNGEANGRPIAKRRLDFGERWSYAPALEANSHIKLRNRYQLFINGRFVSPKSGQYFDPLIRPRKRNWRRLVSRIKRMLISRSKRRDALTKMSG